MIIHIEYGISNIIYVIETPRVVLNYIDQIHKSRLSIAYMYMVALFSSLLLGCVENYLSSFKKGKLPWQLTPCFHFHTYSLSNGKGYWAQGAWKICFVIASNMDILIFRFCSPDMFFTLYTTLIMYMHVNFLCVGFLTQRDKSLVIAVCFIVFIFPNLETRRKACSYIWGTLRPHQQ